MNRITLITLFWIAVIAIQPTPAQADDPPECASLIGVARGLCIAASDLECGSATERSSVACARIEENYLRLTGNMPPWMVTCPCWTPEILEAGGQIDQCTDGIPEDPETAAVSWYRDGFACSGIFCSTRDEYSCGIYYRALGEVIVLSPITPEEHSVCRAQILAVCEGFLE